MAQLNPIGYTEIYLVEWMLAWHSNHYIKSHDKAHQATVVRNREKYDKMFLTLCWLFEFDKTILKSIG